MFPKIKKKIKSFLMDETGSISKSNLIKGALFLTAASTTVKKAKARDFGEIQDNFPTSGHGRGYGCGGEEVWICNAEGGSQTLPGPSSAVWLCTKHHCTMDCVGHDTPRGDDNILPRCCTARRRYVTIKGTERGGHKSEGHIQFQMHHVAEHENGITFTHDRNQKSLLGSHGHHGEHGNWNEICIPGDHSSHCQHASHTSW
ncbi:MAG: hypothetical protein ACMXX5_01795 [Candidatus Woesearchaeota archaeon]